MPKVNQSKIVPYSAKQMYDLVNDYERYPEFLSGCISAERLEQSETELKARLTMSKLGFEQSFSTHNRMIKNEKIDLELIDGPFNYLNGTWIFEELGDCCRISLNLNFEFSNPLMTFAFGTIFNEICSKMIKSFEKRAVEVYGV